MRRLVLAALRPVAELALRVLAELVLPPVLDARDIFAPQWVNKAILSGQAFTLEGAERARIVVGDCRTDVRQWEGPAPLLPRH